MRLMMIRVPIPVKDSGSLPWCLRNAQDNALLQLHCLLRPFSSHNRAGCPTNLEMRLHDTRHLRLELGSRQKIAR